MKKRTKIIIAAISIYGIGLLVFNFIIPQINKMNYNGLKEEAAYLQEYFYAKINPEINNEVVHKFTNRNSIFRVNVLYEEKNSIAINWVIKDQDWQIDDIKNNMGTIFGYANKYKGTTLEFHNLIMRAEDLGNHHYGAVGKAFGFPEKMLLYKAGQNQIEKGNSLPEWIKYKTEWIPNENGQLYPVRILLPPYGDDPIDQSWIQQGFFYYNNQ